jgi:hypothetical protein
VGEKKRTRWTFGIQIFHGEIPWETEPGHTLENRQIYVIPFLQSLRQDCKGASKVPPPRDHFQNRQKKQAYYTCTNPLVTLWGERTIATIAKILQ